MIIEVIEIKTKEWYFSIKSKRGLVICNSINYATKQGAKRGLVGMVKHFREEKTEITYTNYKDK